jgi:hypothetical protein
MLTSVFSFMFFFIFMLTSVSSIMLCSRFHAHFRFQVSFSSSHPFSFSCLFSFPYSLKLGMIIDHWDLPDILYRAWVTGASAANCISGFRATGIWPLNLKWVDEHADVIAPSAIYFREQSAPSIQGEECPVEKSSSTEIIPRRSIEVGDVALPLTSSVTSFMSSLLSSSSSPSSIGLYVDVVYLYALMGIFICDIF